MCPIVSGYIYIYSLLATINHYQSLSITCFDFFGTQNASSRVPGEGYSVNIPWELANEKNPPGDAEFLYAFDRLFLPLLADLAPAERSDQWGDGVTGKISMTRYCQGTFFCRGFCWFPFWVSHFGDVLFCCVFAGCFIFLCSSSFGGVHFARRYFPLV